MNDPELIFSAGTGDPGKTKLEFQKGEEKTPIGIWDKITIFRNMSGKNDRVTDRIEWIWYNKLIKKILNFVVRIHG